MSVPNELLDNLDKLHTTELGVVRIKRNLSLDTDDVVGWCRDKIKSDNAVITRNGKKRRQIILLLCNTTKKVVPEGFVSKEIASYKYMVVEHIGSMDKIYETYSKIYKEILPNT